MHNIKIYIERYQFLNFKFWFQTVKPISLELYLPLGFFVLALVIGLISFLYNRFFVGKYPPKNRFFTAVSWVFSAIGFLGLILVGLRQFAVPYIGARIVLLFFIITQVFSTAVFIRRYKKDLPLEILNYEARKVKEKYLSPRRKNSI